MPSITKMIFGNGPLGPSFAPWIRQRPGLQKYWARWSNFYKNAAGYRQKGYVYDDLIPEENDVVQKAISRLSDQQKYDRVFRLRRGLVQSMGHKNLPKEQWTPADKDVRYLTPLIEQVVAEEAERAEWDNMVVERLKEHKEGKRNIFTKREGKY
ncbi:ubiquinol-cytochrome c reductase subunit 7 [Kwoniella heveanensis CBS 569]|uniref:Complex III subunit 7 n=1 Tax=Kwoniella heveanensis BCC8398 TaxID=1296120 RepID=A0A1B9GX30_9TREE|nr:ubiquinol-cytochrome c reductase subunit 7 [Kwoniella heveanensis BCC8398]OCF40947.1 ubiquinol-cytochrome c reductase subunit 7 [Kwoniella heveanensis CBS 569]